MMIKKIALCFVIPQILMYRLEKDTIENFDTGWSEIFRKKILPKEKY